MEIPSDEAPLFDAIDGRPAKGRISSRHDLSITYGAVTLDEEFDLRLAIGDRLPRREDWLRALHQQRSAVVCTPRRFNFFWAVWNGERARSLCRKRNAARLRRAASQ